MTDEPEPMPVPVTMPAGPARSPADAAAAAPPQGPEAARRRDFLVLSIFVLAQQGYVDRAGILAEALYLSGDESPEVLLARAVLRFFAGDWTAALACLEELDRRAPIERFGPYTVDERQRMRRYLRARCLHELDDAAGAREAAQIYLGRR